MRRNIPKFEVDFTKLKETDSIDEGVMDLDKLNREIVNFIQGNLFDNWDESLIGFLIDKDGTQYEITLLPDSYIPALKKCLRYYEETENYEQCTNIKQILNEIK